MASKDRNEAFIQELTRRLDLISAVLVGGEWFECSAAYVNAAAGIITLDTVPEYSETAAPSFVFRLTAVDGWRTRIPSLLGETTRHSESRSALCRAAVFRAATAALERTARRVTVLGRLNVPTCAIWRAWAPLRRLLEHLTKS